MEKEDYQGAFYFTGHVPDSGWDATSMREVIKCYGDAKPTQKVTVHGRPTDITQRKEVTRWGRNKREEIGEVWYDLNIDGLASDLTATFAIVETDDGLEIQLNDIHVM